MLDLNSMLKSLYETLQNSKEVYIITTGETSQNAYGDRIPGEFVSDINTIVLDENREFSFQILFEEMYHAYQKESGTQSEYNNQEFEAKIAAVAMLSKAEKPYSNMFGIKMFDDIYMGNYGDATHSILPLEQNSKFVTDYLIQGKQFVSNNIKNNIGNKNYKVPVNYISKSFITLINKANGR